MHLVDGVDRWCALCGLLESHRVHERSELARIGYWSTRVDVTDAVEAQVINATAIPMHGFVDGANSKGDGNRPLYAAMRWPGWHPLPDLFGVPLLEGYLRGTDKLDETVRDVHEFIWREPRTHRWRWGCYTPGALFFSVQSETWLYAAIREVLTMAKDHR
jgi:hypothetical protein